MSGLKTKINVLRSKSLRYICFRSWFTFEQKTGLLQRKFPTEMKPAIVPALNDWRMKKNCYFFDDRNSLQIPKMQDSWLAESITHILQGDTLFFGKTWKSLGLDYDWVTNPVTGYKYDIQRHWTKIESLSKEAGDIKFTWEKSRFSWLLTVCRFDYHNDEDHSDFVISQILDWIDNNPLNQGPNYKCSQEISIRLNNWVFALNFYKNSPALTEDRWNRIVTSIYWQIHHVYSNINYSRIAVRNNHAITETLTLYLMGLLFPEMSEAKKWTKNGKKWFEKEIEYQIEEDGTFIQDSMNYHRVVIQLLTYALALSDKFGEKFSDVVYDRAYSSLNFLYQCQNPDNGWLPNYGANDGALFFPLSTSDYRDYRPQLDALHGLLTGEPLYSGFCEDSLWVGNSIPSFRQGYPKVEKKYGIVSFERSGYYLFRETDSFSLIRCGLFKTKGTTDQLHLDIWNKGVNVLNDCGSYLYNSEAEIVRYFSGTESHNTVMLGDDDQMMKGPRFMWFYPPKLLSVSVEESEDSYRFKGTVLCFLYLGSNISLERTVIKKKGLPEWTIIDIVNNKPERISMRQLWHTTKKEILSFVSDGEKVLSDKWLSSYYGTKDECDQIEFRTQNNKITTVIKVSE